jgi:methylthioribose-1-phosphate isomerase
MRTIDWVANAIELVDQTKLPHDVVMLRVHDHHVLIESIARLAVRGAPALGVAGAMGAALVALNERLPHDQKLDAIDSIRNARPTAVNLSWGVDRALAAWEGGADAVLREALAVRDEEIANSWAMGSRGRDVVRSLTSGDVRVMTICNTGGLATVERGTALSVVHALHEAHELAEVLPLETRPLLQGSRLTAWELQQAAVPYRLLIDSAAPFLLSRGFADVVLVGADRIAANGDTANKIGTYSLASAAERAGVPFIVVAPESTVDMNTPTGAEIEIEDRGSPEVIEIMGASTAPLGSHAINPAFDVTPASLVTALVTEKRVVRLSRGETL